MTILSTLLHATNYRNPFLRTLVPSIGAAFAIQSAVAVPSILTQSERYYDLSGSLTYISCTALSLYLPTLRARAATPLGALKPGFPSLFGSLTGAANAGLNWRQVLLSTAVTIWATRLGTFLFSRITAEDGKDSRFDGIRPSLPKFFGAFMAQATWVSLCLLPVLALNSIPVSAFASLPGIVGLTDILGLVLYVGGITFEATADRQKSAWMEEKKAKKHSEEFLTRGLWGKSRHPNYFGEVTLWSGIATASAGVLASGPGLAAMGLSGGLGGTLAALAMAGVSPGFVSFLLFKVCSVLSSLACALECGDGTDPVVGLGHSHERGQVRQEVRREQGLRALEGDDAHVLPQVEMSFWSSWIRNTFHYWKTCGISGFDLRRVAAASSIPRLGITACLAMFLGPRAMAPCIGCSL